MNKRLQILLGIGVVAILIIGLVSCESNRGSPVAPTIDDPTLLSSSWSIRNESNCPNDDQKIGACVNESLTQMRIGFKGLSSSMQPTVTIKDATGEYTYPGPPDGDTMWKDRTYVFGFEPERGNSLQWIKVDGVIIGQVKDGKLELADNVCRVNCTSPSTQDSTATPPK